MSKISAYASDPTLDDADFLIGVDAASGVTKRYPGSVIRAGMATAADITAAKARANHTGTQLANTISDFAAAVTALVGTGSGDMILSALQTVTGAKTFNPGKLLDKGSQVFDVRAFGALGNGIADDTSAIQSAISAVTAAGGGIVWFPSGTYLVTAALTFAASVSFAGAGSAASIINQTTNSVHTFSFTSGSVIDAELNIEGIGLTGPSSGTGDGIHFSGVPLAYVNLKDVAASNFGGTGVYVAGAIVSRLERVVSTSNGAHGIWCDGTTSFTTSVHLDACYGNNNVKAGIHIKQATYLSLDACAADSNGVGYYFLSCFGLAANGCGAESTVSHGATGYTNAESFLIEGDVVFGGGATNLTGCYSYDTHGIGFHIKGTAIGVTLISCEDNTPHAGATASIKTESGTTATLIGCTWAGAQTFNGDVVVLNDDAGVSTLKHLRTATIMDINGNNVLAVNPTASAVNSLTTTNAATGQAVILGATGTDTDVYLNLTTKGAGTVRANNVDVRTIHPRVLSQASSANPFINTDALDYYELTAQTTAITSFTTNLSGTPVTGQKLWISITGTASRAITWGSSFEASTVALPTTTTSTSRLDVEFMWNAATSKWRCVRVA